MPAEEPSSIGQRGDAATTIVPPTSRLSEPDDANGSTGTDAPRHEATNLTNIHTAQANVSCGKDETQHDYAESIATRYESREREGPGDPKLANENEKDVERAETNASLAPVHSVFSKRERLFVVVMAAIAGFFSPLWVVVIRPPRRDLAFS